MAKAMLKRGSSRRSNRPTKKARISKIVGGLVNGGKLAKRSSPKTTVAVNDLAWKTVDVTNRVDDFEGFYGLEEVEGVSVEVENGAVKFKAVVRQGEKKVDNEVEPESENPTDSIVNSDGEEESTAEYSVEHDESKEKTIQQQNKKSENEKKRKTVHNQTMVSLHTSMENPFDLLEQDAVDTSNVEWNLDGATLSSEILQALAKLKFATPTEIQKNAIPEILNGSDVIGKAATGSGKTLAYGIPIIERHMRLSGSGDKKWPTALIFGPTRELAHQITNHLTKIWEYCGLPGSGVVSITGGLAVQKQKRLLENNPAFVVATPGRFLDILNDSKAEVVEMFAKCETLVLDEADRLIQQGHFQELEKILDLIGRGRKSKRQTLVFSATFQMDLMNKLDKKQKKGGRRFASQKDAMQMLNSKLEFKDRHPVYIDSNPAEAVAREVMESIMECGAMEKDLHLYYFLLTYPGRTIVFVNSIDAVKRLTPLLKELNLASIGLHSDMIQKQRLRSLERFRDNRRGILVATDVAARGLDIPLVDHVIHYHLPRTADMYVHRSGRTARAGNEGVSLILCSPDEASGPLVKLKRVLYKDSNDKATAMKSFIVEYDFLIRLKSRVSLAQQIVDSVSQSTHKGKSEAWLKQAADDLGVDLDNDEFENLEGSHMNKKRNQKTNDSVDLKSLRAQLKQELDKPVGYAGKYLTRGTINLAHIVTSGKSHESFLGLAQENALEKLKR
jgi:ATP-dependent RNA helicase DDX24/MAK5